MIITEWQMYWITRLTDIKETLVASLIIIGLLSLVVAIVMTVVTHDTYDKDDKKICLKYFRKAYHILIISLIGIGLSVFIPTTKDMAAIKVIPMIANDAQVQELPNKIVNLGNEWLESLRPNDSTK